MNEEYHQISAFAAAIAENGKANAAFSVYDMGEVLVTRWAEVKGISEHRALLLAVWSAANWCKKNIPQCEIPFYTAEKRVSHELFAVWTNESESTDFEDADRITDIINDCQHIKAVGFEFCALNETGVWAEYSRRMRSLVELVK